MQLPLGFFLWTLPEDTIDVDITVCIQKEFIHSERTEACKYLDSVLGVQK